MLPDTDPEETPVVLPCVRDRRSPDIWGNILAASSTDAWGLLLYQAPCEAA